MILNALPIPALFAVRISGNGSFFAYWQTASRILGKGSYFDFTHLFQSIGFVSEHSIFKFLGEQMHALLQI